MNFHGFHGNSLLVGFFQAYVIPAAIQESKQPELVIEIKLRARQATVTPRCWHEATSVVRNGGSEMSRRPCRTSHFRKRGNMKGH